jgi:hypothetical protein
MTKMLKVKNSNIWLTRGETNMLSYTAVRRDGKPYILAPAANLLSALVDRQDYAILAFTVRTAVYGDIVLEKYFDLESAPMYNGVTDLTTGGFHKFSSQDIVPATNLSDVVQFNKVYLLDGTYVTRVKKSDGSNKVVPYSFKIQIPFFWSDTEKLETKEYIYDLTLYYGALVPEVSTNWPSRDTYTKFPLQENAVLVKIPLIPPHKFTVEDSNNV